MVVEAKFLIARFLRSTNANVAMAAAIAAPVLLAVAGLAADYALIFNQRAQLQEAADSAVLAGARELGIAGTDNDEIVEIVTDYVNQNYYSDNQNDDNVAQMNIGPMIGSDRESITVNVELYWRPFLAHFIDTDVLPIRVSARAELAGSENICLLALDRSQAQSINLGSDSLIDAEFCMIHTNSSNRAALAVQANSTMTAVKSCTAGGYSGTSENYRPTPIVDCPQIDDPLRARTLPNWNGNCTYNGVRIIEGETRRLQPGVYCGGIIGLGSSTLNLDPGIYTIVDGDFDIGDAATLNGTGVTLHFERDARLFFRNNSTISIDAPRTGSMAGIVISSSRSNDPNLVFEIESKDARRLTGLIYLPENTLKLGDDLNNDGTCDPDNDDFRQFPYNPNEINSLRTPHVHYHQHADGTIHRHPHANTYGIVSSRFYPLVIASPSYRLHHQENLFHGHPAPISDCKTNIGEFSDWTAIISRNINVSAGVELILNADYDNSPIPYPVGSGTGSDTVRLTQ